MIDIETTGTDPVFNAIIQIAAVRFNYETGEIGSVFNASLDVPYSRHWDEGTREWWMKRADVYADIVANAQPAATVFKIFAEWCRHTAPALSGVEQHLWAKPISFEWPFLQSYCRQFDEDLGFHYRNAVDLNSFCRGLANNPSLPPIDKQVEFDGTAHNALDDTFHQVKVALLARSIIQGASA
jgi:DNA polymerase III epsilon subunit-like protein